MKNTTRSVVEPAKSICSRIQLAVLPVRRSSDAGRSAPSFLGILGLVEEFLEDAHEHVQTFVIEGGGA